MAASGDPETCPACGGWHIGTGEVCPRACAGTWNTGGIVVYGSSITPVKCAGCDGAGTVECWDEQYRCSNCAEIERFRHMTRGELQEILTLFLGDEVFAARFADCMEMIRRKNADYTQGVAKRDRIAAFRRIGGDIDVPMAKVWAIFAQKHWGAVMKFVKDGQVESEPIDGRINDLINYFVLLGAIIHDGEQG